MRSASWLDALDHELASLGIAVEERAQLVVETDGFLNEAGADPLAHFGPPADYARQLADALGSTPAATDRDEGQAVVDVIGVSKRYRSRLRGGSAPAVVDDVSLTVASGDVAALVGPNGSGKSTLLRLIGGLERPDSGTIRVEGTIGYVPQSGGLDPHLNGSEHIDMFGTARGLDRAAARQAGALLADQLGWSLSDRTLAGNLSGGTRQKLSVICAMVGEPTVLLLDEPYQGMDAESGRRFWDLLWAWADDLGRAAVVSTHQADVLSRARTVIELDRAGEVVRG